MAKKKLAVQKTSQTATKADAAKLLAKLEAIAVEVREFLSRLPSGIDSRVSTTQSTPTRTSPQPAANRPPMFSGKGRRKSGLATEKPERRSKPNRVTDDDLYPSDVDT